MLLLEETQSLFCSPQRKFFLEKWMVHILLPKLFRPTVRKKSCSDWKKVLRFEAEGREFSNFLRSLEQFIQTRSEQFLITDCFIYQLVPGGFSYLINQNNYNSNWKKWLGFRHMQEKLEKKMLCNFNLMIRFISCYNSLRKCRKPTHSSYFAELY